MEREPSRAVEKDGDIIPLADYLGSELDVPGYDDTEEYYESLADEAVQAASKIIEEQSGALEQDLPSAAEMAFDAAAEFVHRREDQGRDADAAWAEVDPGGAIRRAHEQEIQARQHKLNQQRAEELRQRLFESQLAEVEQIYDPAKREVARHELLARKRAADSRRGRRA